MLFFESRDSEVFKADRYKLFASNEKQIDNHTLMVDMLTETWQFCVPSIVEVSLKTFFGVAVVLCWSFSP